MSRNKLEKIIHIAFLVLIILMCYYGQYQFHKRVENAMNYCYQFSTDKAVCDEVYGILDPQE